MRTRSTRTGVPLTELGLGTAQLGDLGRAMSDEEVAATVDSAWESGIRYFDTAPHYGVGRSESRLGERLRSRPRDHYVLSTKVGRLLEPSPSTAHLRDDGGFDVPRDPVRRWDFTRDGVLRSIEKSLQRLGLDRIDIVFLHDADQSGQLETALTEGVQTLLELRDEGVVRGVGAGMNAAAPLAELIRRADVDVVMCANAFTLLRPDALDELLPLALEREVSVLAAAVFNSGVLAAPRPAPDATFVYGPVPGEILERTERIADVCERHGVTLPVAAMAYVLRHPAVVGVVAGARGRGQVRQNVERLQTPVPDDLWIELEREGLIPRQ